MGQVVHINLDPDHVRTRILCDVTREKIVQADSSEISVSLIPNGTAGGQSVIAFSARLPDGRVVFLQMTAANFLLALRAEWIRNQEAKQ